MKHEVKILDGIPPAPRPITAQEMADRLYRVEKKVEELDMRTIGSVVLGPSKQSLEGLYDRGADRLTQLLEEEANRRKK